MADHSVSQVYKANLQRVGTLIPETITLLSEYTHLHDWGQVRDLALNRNLLRKRSSHTVSFIIHAVEQRFFNDYKDLPSAKQVAKIMAKEIATVAKSQIVFVYICMSDELVKALVTRLRKEKLRGYSDPKLTQDGVVELLSLEARAHQELAAWSDYLKRRWARGFLAMLRDTGFMEPAPKNKLIAPLVRIEAFTFFLLHMLNSGVSPNEALRHPTWDLYMLEKTQIAELVVEAQARGWLYYSSAGDVLEVKPRYTNAEEWADGALGR